MSNITHVLADKLTALGWMMATAESCTGGLIAAQCTDLPGSSRWFDRGLVTYSNAAKTELLGVDPSLIAMNVTFLLLLLVLTQPIMVAS